MKTEAKNDAKIRLGRFPSLNPFSQDLKKSADTVEILLLLLWRHLEYFVNGSHVQINQIKASTPQIARLVASTDFNTFRDDTSKKLGYVLQKLEALDMVSNPRLLR